MTAPREPGPGGIVTLPSPGTVDGVVRRLTALISERGLTLFCVIDHSAAAERVQLAMPDTKVLVFGSPAAGTPVMLASPLVAFDLPLRILVADAAGGGCTVSYLPGAALAARHGLDDAQAARLDGAAGLVAAVVSGPPGARAAG